MSDETTPSPGAQIHLRNAEHARNEADKLVAKGEWALAAVMHNAAIQYELRAKKAQTNE
jgi:hypothetical protein